MFKCDECGQNWEKCGCEEADCEVCDGTGNKNHGKGEAEFLKCDFCDGEKLKPVKGWKVEILRFACPICEYWSDTESEGNIGKMKTVECYHCGSHVEVDFTEL